VSMMRSKYGDDLYDITMVKAQDGTMQYVVRTQKNGVFSSATHTEDGSIK
jgi:hypothetical protein